MVEWVIQRIKCLLAELFKKYHWHDWEVLYEQQNEYEPGLINGERQCRCCGLFTYYTKGK